MNVSSRADIYPESISPLLYLSSRLASVFVPFNPPSIPALRITGSLLKEEVGCLKASKGPQSALGGLE